MSEKVTKRGKESKKRQQQRTGELMSVDVAAELPIVTDVAEAPIVTVCNRKNNPTQALSDTDTS